MQNKEKPEVLDTTLRDGEQMDKVSFSPIEKLSIAKKLFDAGVDRIEVASARAVKEDEDAVRKICAMAEERGKLDSVEVLGFVDGEKSIDWIYNLGCRTVNLLAKGSKEHCERQLNKTLEQHLWDIRKSVDYAKSKSMTVNVYLEDWSAGIIDSPEYVLGIVRELRKMGISRIMLPDTRGLLSPWQTEEHIGMMISEFPDVHFDYHAHNDYGIATANTLAALRKGVHGIHATLNTLGERAGNASLYEAAAAAKDLLGIDFGIDESMFYELRRIVEEASRIRLAPHAPLVGENSYKQTAGIHADGDKKGDLYFRKLAPERFGFGKNVSYSLGKQAGVASVEMNLAQMGVEADDETKRKLTMEVRRLGAMGKTVTQEDLYLLFHNALEKPENRPFEIIDAKADVSMNGARIGYVKFRLYDEIAEATAFGDGGYNAIMNALAGKLGERGIKLPQLVDYQPRIPPGGKTDAIVDTLIEWVNGSGSFLTNGIEADQTMSAVLSTEKMVNLVLMKYKKLTEF